MSGTSADGIDLALIDDAPLCLQARDYVPFDDTLKSAVLNMIQGNHYSPLDMLRFESDLAEAYGAAILSFMNKNNIDKTEISAIGLHGQTVAHWPDESKGNSWQLGHPAKVAALTGIPVVSDFRRMDMALGGQGAPLAPALHEALFKQPGQIIGVLNLGGIANISIIDDQLIGFDVGPANCLLDEWCLKHTGQSFDNKGEWAKSGQISQGFLAHMLQDSYFLKAPPKSTGREYFNQRWLIQQSQTFNLPAVDVQRSLIALVAESLRLSLQMVNKTLDQLIVVGGGVHNQLMMDSLREILDCELISSEEQGVSPDDIEAMLMAWLAARHCRHQKTDLSAVTGCQKAHVYGIRFWVD